MATPSPYSSELALALQAVHAASLLTKSVLRSLSNHVGAETKADDSPVTVADFAAQAIIISIIQAVYPSDAFLGEESADALRRDGDLGKQVWQLVQRAASPSAAQSGEVQQQSSLAFPASEADMLDAIDRGRGEQTARGRVWVMDPVDGTATFMEGQQYAVSLCLLVDGVQQVGVVGCPNLKFDASASPLRLGERIHEDLVDREGHGVVLSAVNGQGTYVRSVHVSGLGEPRRVEHQETQKPLASLNFVESTLGKSSLSQPEHRAAAELLSAEWPGTVLWSQQMKYAALTLGATDVMLRLPTDKRRYTYTWDHAGGNLLFTEAGGVIKDIDGGTIDFSQGRKILGDRNYGMVAAMPWSYEKVVQAVHDVLKRRTQQ